METGRRSKDVEDTGLTDLCLGCGQTQSWSSAGQASCGAQRGEGSVWQDGTEK